LRVKSYHRITSGIVRGDARKNLGEAGLWADLTALGYDSIKVEWCTSKACGE